MRALGVRGGRIGVAAAVAAYTATAVAGAQEFVVQPPPMVVVSGPVAPVSQSFDQPAPGARSPRNANYDMDVRLDPAAHTLTGRETLRWRNISRQPASELQFHLYWNAWRNADSTWLRERRLGGNRTPIPTDAWGSIDVTSLRVQQANQTWLDLTHAQRFIAPDDENASDRTVMAVTLPRTVQPNETVDVEMAWTAKIPRPFSRTGYVGNYFFIGQWFPKIGVLEDASWNTHQFHNRTEFYADFGVYDVRITTPRGWLVGCSGVQTVQQDNPDNTTTHRFHGEDIHDVAWTTSPDFVEARQTFSSSPLPTVEMRLLLLRDHLGQAARYFAGTAAALHYYGDWFGAYPYRYLTIVDPAYQSRSDGMEYPTLFTGGTRWIAPALVATPEAVTIHEAGHQFWYAIVANNEFEHAWMDEGFNQFSEARTTEAAAIPDYLSRRFFGGFVPWVIHDIPTARDTVGNGFASYRANAKAEVPATPTFRYWPAGPSANAITYFKTALWLHTLERYLGWPTLQRIMSTYFNRWKFRHPKPQDFFAVANEVSGRDLTWFVDQVYRGSNVFDYALQDLTSERADSGRYHTVVVAQRLGEAVFPVDVATTFQDGRKLVERWDGQARRVEFVYDTPSAAVSAEVDPGHVLLLDVNRTNNSKTLQPKARAASLKWALTWMTWLQDLMMTYGFFV
jgi:aminopeptidase N